MGMGTTCVSGCPWVWQRASEHEEERRLMPAKANARVVEGSDEWEEVRSVHISKKGFCCQSHLKCFKKYHWAALTLQKTTFGVEGAGKHSKVLPFYFKVH
jgi:hypothetical protein